MVEFPVSSRGEENTIQNPCSITGKCLSQVSCCLSSERQQRSIIMVSPL
ncbi:rCG45050 [Rattus norvegicus]|uniref:RCG45050 n=1 Tax=Rattus norvegicus TaxID=10116 RepID=A6KR30_RAT|nr:rCG45050 [Rattus norvegicus]